MNLKYRGLDISFKGFGWVATDGNTDAEFVDGVWRHCGGVLISTGPLATQQDLFRAIDEHFADEANLSWEFSDGSTWTAFSATGTAVNPFLWRIGVCEDGTFDINETDNELQPAFGLGSRKVPTFPTLEAAKQFCEEAEIRCQIQADANETPQSMGWVGSDGLP